jgi:hypothetical protein
MKVLWIAALVAVVGTPTPTPGPGNGAVTQSQNTTLSVSVGGRAPATLKIAAGSRARIELPEVFQLALVPSPGAGELTVEVRNLLVGDPAKGTLIQTLRLMPGESVTFVESGTAIDVRWVVDPLASNVSRSASTAPDGDCENCCLTCDGVQYCSCKVTTVCAECCCWQCCHIMTSTEGVAATSVPAATCSSPRPTQAKAPVDRR